MSKFTQLMRTAQIKSKVRPLSPDVTNQDAWMDTPDTDRHANTMTMQSIETEYRKQDKQEWILEIRRSNIQRLFGNRKLYIR